MVKKFTLVIMLLICGLAADAAAPVGARGRSSSGAGGTVTQTAARAARTSGVRNSAQATNTGKVVSRSATNQPSQPKQTAVQQRGRSATTPVATQSVSRGRAAKTQSVINSGTKVTAATQNTVVDEECWTKFSGCMDSFCMLDNANGGRCMCSNDNAKLDSILAEIQKLDTQSYEMATAGVEKINMGEDGDAVIAKTEEITKSIIGDNTKSKRNTLDLSQWNTTNLEDEAEEDIFSFADADDLSKKTGDALFVASSALCNTQIPECSSQTSLMDLMYKQRVRSDCAAYENSLKQQRTQSAQKLAAAQNAMREAALEQYRNANKYDLGQCTAQFKQCMQTTAGCGEDFAGCVSPDYTAQKLRNKKKTKQTQIKGALTTIEIAASTFDMLESKKPLCASVTQNCVAVRDQVWDTFMREVAPELKSAELIAESNLRTSCTTKISECFHKACKDNIDPKDPDGSYDLCLTRPETFRSLCKVEIDPCEAMDKNIMESVYAVLASMRVDSCTKDFKTCLQSEDRCGSDYTQCIGLDTDTIVRLCPAESLDSCRFEGNGKSAKDEEEIYTELSKIAQGIFLSIDNNLLSSCIKFAQNKVVEVCGSLDECAAFEADDIIGTDSLISYKDNNGNTVIDGLINFGLLSLKISNNTTEDGYESAVKYETDQTKYKSLFDNNSENATVNRIQSAINTVSNRAKQKLDVIAQDPKVSMCINGRDKNWRYSKTKTTDNSKDKFSRFPHLLDSYGELIFNAGLEKAYKNYNAKYDELVGNALEDQNDDVKSALCAAMATSSTNSGPECTKYGILFGQPVCTKYEPKGVRSLFGSDDSSNKTGMKTLNGFDISYTIRGADITAKLQTAAGGKGEYVYTDNDGNMIGTIIMASSYSPATNTCSLTTTTTTCENIKAIITSDTNGCSTGFSMFNMGGGCGQGGIATFGGGRTKTQTKQSYHGNVCTKYSKPETETKEIKM